MKKTLHGKRHIRARKIVAVTRIKKRIKKFNQAVRYVKIFEKRVDATFQVMVSIANKLLKERLKSL